MNQANKRKRESKRNLFPVKSNYGFASYRSLPKSKEDEEIGKFSSSESEDEIYSSPANMINNKLVENIRNERVDDKTVWSRVDNKTVWSSDNSDSTVDESNRETQVDEFNESICINEKNPKNISIDEYNSDDEYISQIESDALSQKELAQVNEVDATVQSEKTIFDDVEDMEESFETDPPKDESLQITVELSPPIIKKPYKSGSNTTDIFQYNIKEEKEDEDKVDSAKKIKRCIKGGFVERLNKLLLREKSDHAFWKHGLKSNSDMDVTLCLQVISINSVFSLTSIHCKLLNNQMELYLILPDHIVEKLTIKPKDQFNLFPPWKRMFNRDMNSVVLLCAYHINVLIKDDDCKMASNKATQDLLEYYAKQLNSCGQSNQLDDLSDINVGVLLETTSYNTSSKNNEDNPSKFTSIVKSIESNSYSGKISFAALIQRIFCKIQRKGTHLFSLQDEFGSNEIETVYSLLVQDNVGMLSEIYVRDSSTRWEELINNGEGSLCHFNNVKLIKRLSHSKNACYHSLVQPFLPSKEDLVVISSQLEEDSDSVEENVFNIPYCSYVFYIDFQSQYTKRYNEAKEFSFSYVLQQMMKTGDLSHGVTNTRVSIHARLIAIVQCEQDYDLKNSIDSELMFYVLNLKDSGVSFLNIKKLWKCSISQNVSTKINSNTDCFVNLYFKDVRVNDGRLFADEYSRIFLTPTNHQLELQSSDTPSLINQMSCGVAFEIQSLCINNREGDVITIKGIICGIDEDTALFWNICSVCASDNIMKDDQQRLWCDICDTECEVELKMQLDVILYVDSLSQCSVVCTLLESTIKDYLSSPKGFDFEGFDIASILQKNFTERLCEVIHIVEDAENAPNEKKFYLRELRQYFK